MEYAYQACWRVRTSYRTTNGTVEVEGLCFADSEADVRQRPNVQRALREDAPSRWKRCATRSALRGGHRRWTSRGASRRVTW